MRFVLVTLFLASCAPLSMPSESTMLDRAAIRIERASEALSAGAKVIQDAKAGGIDTSDALGIGGVLLAAAMAALQKMKKSAVAEVMQLRGPTEVERAAAKSQ